jgi:hypothetical protein
MSFWDGNPFKLEEVCCGKFQSIIILYVYTETNNTSPRLSFLVFNHLRIKGKLRNLLSTKGKSKNQLARKGKSRND